MSMKTIIFRSALVSVVFVAALIVASQAVSAEITLKVHHFLGDESLPHQSLIEPWARRIENNSGGRIKVEIYPAMTLGGKAPELIGQVREGVVDIIWTAAAYTPGRFPRSEVFTLPLVHGGDPVATNLAIMASLDDRLAGDFKGLKPLLVHVHSGHAIHLGNRPVTQLANFKGLILRPAGRGIGLWTVEALGAGSTKKRHPKLPKALKKHALDGALMSFQLAQSMGVIDAVKSHTMLDGGNFFGTSLYLFLMNQARYDSLPDDLRAVIDSNSGTALAKEAGHVWREATDTAIEAARARGNKIHILDTELPPVREALQQVTNRWARQMEKQGINGPQLIKEARRAISRNSQVTKTDTVSK